MSRASRGAASRRWSARSPCSTRSRTASSSAPTRSRAARHQRQLRLAAALDARCGAARGPGGRDGALPARPATRELGNAALARLDVRELARPHLRALVAAPVRRRRCPCRVTSSRSRSTSCAARPRCRVSRRSAGRASRTPPPPGRCCSPSGRSRCPAARSTRTRSNTIVEPTQLEREVTRVRSQGWAQAVREREDDLNCDRSSRCVTAPRSWWP